MPDIRKDALYARQSIDKKDSISIESQLEYCSYEAHGNPYMSYSDKGFSGKDTQRPDFERMMDDVRSDRIKRVIVYKLDRISRSILDFATMIEVFQEHDVEFVSATEKFDTSTPIGRAMLNICIVFAQLERETICRRCFDAYHSRCRKGYHMSGVAPYGFKLEPFVLDGIHTKRLSAVMPEISHVETIFHLYGRAVKDNGERYSFNDVIDYLVAHGMQKAGGKCWTASAINLVLANPSYAIADAELYEFFRVSGADIASPPELWDGSCSCYIFRAPGAKSKSRHDLKDKVITLAPHPGRIPSKDWIECRTRCVQSTRLASNTKAKSSWLVGKTKCGHCGHALVIYRPGKGAVKRTRYLRCNRRYSTRGQGCAGLSRTIYADDVEAYMSGEIKRKLEELGPLSKGGDEKPSPAQANRQRRIAEIEWQIAELVDKTPMASPALMRHINERVEELDVSLRDLERENFEAKAARPSELLGKLIDGSAAWDDATLEEKQRVLDLLISSIHITEDEIEVAWKV